MFLELFKKSINSIKELHEMALFTLMADADIFLIFKSTPLYYIMLPIVGILATVQALASGYELLTGKNKNLNRWLSFIASSLSATLVSISLYGVVIASYYGLSFALAPWLLLGSVGVAFTHQMVLVGLNFYRAYESLGSSVQRKHYLQAALNNLFQLGIMTTVIGGLTFLMFTPIAPMLGTICALSAVGLSTAHILWRVMPSGWRGTLKGLLNLDKSQVKAESTFISNQEFTKKLEPESVVHYSRIFTKRDYKAEIQNKNFGDGLLDLNKVIQEKISVYESKPLPHSPKDIQKKELLSDLAAALGGDVNFSKKHLLEFRPLAFESFLVDKSEVEQIVDAALVLRDKYQASLIELENCTEMTSMQPREGFSGF